MNFLLRPKFLLFTFLLLIVLLDCTSTGKKVHRKQVTYRTTKRLSTKPSSHHTTRKLKTHYPVGSHVPHTKPKSKHKGKDVRPTTKKPKYSHSGSGKHIHSGSVTTTIKNGIKNGMKNGMKNGIKNGIKNGMKNGIKNGVKKLTNAISGIKKPTTTTPKPKPKSKPSYVQEFKDPYWNEIFKSGNYTKDPQKLVSQEYFRTSITTCGTTLCSEVINYPTDEISRIVEKTRQHLKSDNTIASFEDKGLSYKNFASTFDNLWFGKAAPEHSFVDNSTNCKEHVTTYYPQEGSAHKKRYYVVNVPTLKQALTKIECESTYEMCNGEKTTSKTYQCQQLYRKEHLLVLPHEKSKFAMKDFELKSFYVPTGCGCIAS